MTGLADVDGFNNYIQDVAVADPAAGLGGGQET